MRCSCGEESHGRRHLVRDRIRMIVGYLQSVYPGKFLVKESFMGDFECHLGEHTLEFRALVEVHKTALFDRSTDQYIDVCLVDHRNDRRVLAEEDWRWGNRCKEKLEALVALLARQANVQLEAQETTHELPKYCECEPPAGPRSVEWYRMMLARNRYWTEKEFTAMSDHCSEIIKTMGARDPKAIQTHQALQDAQVAIIWYRRQLAEYIYSSLREAGLPERVSCHRGDNSFWGFSWPHDSFGMVWGDYQMGVQYTAEKHQFHVYARGMFSVDTADPDEAIAAATKLYFTLFPSKSALISKYLEAAYDNVRTCRQKSVYMCTFPGGFTLELEDKNQECDTLFRAWEVHILARLVNDGKVISAEDWRWDKSCKANLEALVTRVIPLPSLMVETKCDSFPDCPPVPLKGAELVEWYRKEFASSRYISKAEFEAMKDQARWGPAAKGEMARVKEAQTTILRYREMMLEYVYQSLRLAGLPMRYLPCFRGKPEDLRWPDDKITMCWNRYKVGLMYTPQTHDFSVLVDSKSVFTTASVDEAIAQTLKTYCAHFPL